MERGLISVIVPVYNLEDYVGKAIESLQEQVYKNIEIIIVDDGSTDGTGDIIDEYEKRDKRIVVVHKQNGGVTSARLKGVEIARGEWIGFVDGDDIVESNMYQQLIDNANKYNAQISHCGYQMIFGDGRVHYFHNSGQIIEQNKIKGILDLLEGKMVEPGLGNKIYKKELFQKIIEQQLMNCDVKINEDLLMNYYLFKDANKSVFHDICPYHYIIRNGSASRRQINANRIYDPIKVKKIILEDNFQEVKNEARKAYISTLIDIYNSIIIAKDSRLQKDKMKIISFIQESKLELCLLSVRRKIMGWMILTIPSFYDCIYRVYEKYFQKKKYN